MNKFMEDERAVAEQGAINKQMAERPADVAEKVGEHPEGPTGAETILLVEDQAFVRAVTGEVLRSAGYRVLEARHAAEARCAYAQQLSDVGLLLTDLVLPGESGSALAKSLGHQSPGLKVLLITGYPEQMALWGVEAEHCLAKPFSTTVLLQKVRQLLARGEPRMDQTCMGGTDSAGCDIASGSCGQVGWQPDL